MLTISFKYGENKKLQSYMNLLSIFIDKRELLLNYLTNSHDFIMNKANEMNELAKELKKMVPNVSDGLNGLNNDEDDQSAMLAEEPVAGGKETRSGVDVFSKSIAIFF